MGVGFAPTLFLLNRQVGYSLPDPTVEPTAGIAPASHGYEPSSLLLTYAGTKWRARWVLPPLVAVLRTTVFADSPRAR